MDVCVQSGALFGGRFVREAGECRVKELPCCAPEFCSARCVLASCCFHCHATITAYFAVSLPSLGAITCPLRVESCRSILAGATPAGTAPDPPANGCLTPTSWDRKEKTNVKARKAETVMRMATNLRLGPGATGMLMVLMLDVRLLSIVASCRWRSIVEYPYVRGGE